MLLTGFRFITIRYWVTLLTQLHHVRYDTHAPMCFDNFDLFYWFMDLFISPHLREVSYFTNHYFPKWNAYRQRSWSTIYFDSINDMLVIIYDLFNLQKNFNPVGFFIFAFLHLLIKNIIYEISCYNFCSFM